MFKLQGIAFGNSQPIRNDNPFKGASKSRMINRIVWKDKSENSDTFEKEVTTPLKPETKHISEDTKQQQENK